MLAQFAAYLWSWLSGLANSVSSFFAQLFTSLSNAIGSALQWLGTTIGGFFTWLFNGIKGLFQWLLNGITGFFQALFAPILAIINAFFYFVSQLTNLVVLLFQLLLQIAHVLLSFAIGLIRTFAGFSYNNGSPSLPLDVQDPFTHMNQALGLLQLDNVAYVLRFAVWLFVAVSVVRITSNFGMGGGGE